jgi:hypothetical protein
MLCEHAYEAYEKYGTYDATSVAAVERRKSEGWLREESPVVEVGAQRGMLVDYESLPGIIPRLVLPHLFGIAPSSAWLASMEKESREYSKGRGQGPKAGVFTGDSAEKERKANAEVKKYSDAILQPTFVKLAAASQHAVDVLAPSPEEVPRGVDNKLDLAVVKTYPSKMTARQLATPAFDPFAATHNSSAHEVRRNK